jgi:predicted dehydrogenase
MNLGIVGGRRGRVYLAAERVFRPRVRVHAVCDVDEAELDAWRREAPDVIRYARLEDLLSDDEITAVYIATPASYHARHTGLCLAAGKDVLCEVPAVLTLEEAYSLIQTVEQSERIYMLAENYCYIPEVRWVRRLCEEGRFGEITYAEGQYLHDCRSLFWKSDGSLTWRGELRRDFRGNSYPTHSLGPIAQWLGLGAAGRDQLVNVAAYRTDDRSLRLYARKRWGARHPSAAEGFFNHGDRIVTVLTTRRGATVVLHLDTHSPRPPQKAGFALQGTRGAYLSGRYEGEGGLVWLGHDGGEGGSGKAIDWAPVQDYGRGFFEGEAALGEFASCGRRAAEYMVLADFLAATEASRASAIDVYDAVTWSVVADLSRRSIKEGNRPVDVPAFRPAQGKRVGRRS